jgi:hypothetical protein
LCFSWPLPGTSGSSGTLAYSPTPALSLCCFTCVFSQTVQHWEFDSLPHPHSPEQVHCSTPISAVDVWLHFTVYLFQFCWVGGFNLPRVCAGLCSWIVGRGITHGAWCSPVCSADPHKQLWNCWHGEMAQHKEDFHRLWVQDVIEFNSDWWSVFFGPFDTIQNDRG